jgi:outer membrane protein OmpA-like peptidoglycan-associated protein
MNMIAMLFSLKAFSQDLDVHGFYPSPNDGDTIEHISTWQAEAYSPGTISLNTTLEYAAKPLTIHRINENGSETKKDLVDDITALNIGLHYSPSKRLALTVTAPAYFGAEVRGTSRGLGLGSTRVATPITLLTPEAQGFGLSLIPFLDTPGFYSNLLSTDSFSGGAIFAISIAEDDWTFSSNIGAEFSRKQDFVNLNGKENLVANIALAKEIVDSTSLGIEVVSRPSLRNNQFAGTESPIEAVLDLRSKLDENIFWNVGVSKSLNRGVSAATWRALVGLNVSLGKKNDILDISDTPIPCDPIYIENVVEVERERLVEINGDKLLLMKPIYFDFNKDEVRIQDSQQVMIDLAEILLEHKEITLVRVATGTDPRGSATYNKDLSLRRAQSVVNFLVEHGVEKERLVSHGYGESNLPMGSCSTEECYELDRFAEFSILKID